MALRDAVAPEEVCPQPMTRRTFCVVHRYNSLGRPSRGGGPSVDTNQLEPRDYQHETEGPEDDLGTPFETE
jgi:hypothetical protein